jgi:hypothetical protein
VAGKCHPSLNQKCMARYIWSAFIFPGERVDYLGQRFTPPPLEPDEDWTITHAPDGVQLNDYDVSVLHVVRAAGLLPLKLLCPTYSPIFKID